MVQLPITMASSLDRNVVPVVPTTGCLALALAFFPGHANLRSIVREASVRSIFQQYFFPFLEIFLSFSEKNKFRHFFMSQKKFQVKIWWVEKISRNKLVS